MSISGNRSLFSSIAAMVSIILYAAALFFGTARILINSNSRGLLAEKEFKDILDRVSSAAILGFMSKSYQEVIQDSIMDSETLLGLIISGSNGEFGFERQYGSVINWIGDTPRFRTGLGIAKNPYFQSIRIEGQRNTTVQAIYSLFDYDLLIRVLKETLMIIVIILALAVITLFIEINIKMKAAENRETVITPVPDQVSSGYISSGGTEPAYPKGLYSPRGIGWESYTKERLESELHRCAASEEDLVFMVMESRQLFREEAYKKFADEGVDFFTERDMVFEKGEQGMALIIPTLNIDQGFTKSEEFRKHIHSSMTAASGVSPELCIGMSSRAGRLVEADRLILEASEALSKALKDHNSPIVAFKSDLEKYRDFISRSEN